MKCAIVCVLVSLLVAYAQAQLGYTLGGYGAGLPYVGYAGLGGVGMGGFTGYGGVGLAPTQGFAVSSYAPGYTTGYTGYVPSYGVQYRTTPVVAGAAAPAMVTGGAYPALGGVPAFGAGGLGYGNVPIGASMPALLTRLYGAGAGAGAAGGGGAAVASKK